MRGVRAILVIVLASLLGGCLIRGKQPVVQNTPPPVEPAPQPEPAPPPAPLSIPQTQVELPPPQPVTAEAAAAAEAPSGPSEPASLPTRSTGGSRRPAGPPPIAAPKPEPAASVPAATPPAPVAPLENTPPIQEIVPVEEQKKLQEAADNRKREIRQILDQAATRRLNHRETGLKRTIESYLKLFEQAEGKGDLRQANEIAERAWALAKDLQGGH